MSQFRVQGDRIGIVVAPKMDMHAVAIRESAKAVGRTIVTIDTAEFTSNFDLIARWVGKKQEAALAFEDGSLIDLAEVSGLWWRRPRQPDVSTLVNPAFAEVAAREAKDALWGTLNSIVPIAFNELGSSRAADQKPLQLSRACDLGLDIPETLITNDAEAARRFYGTRPHGIIYKVFKGPQLGFYPTRMVEREDLENLAALKHSPCIFQEYVKGLYDLRVTVVGNTVFAAKIDYDRNSEIIDTRATARSCSRYELPQQLCAALVDLARSFGLLYCAIDLRRAVDGSYVFFELNPEGQYLWTEIEAGLPISASIVNLLTQQSET